MIKLFRAAITVIAVIFLLWFIAPVFFGVRNIGNALGILICSALIFRFGLTEAYTKLKYCLCSHTATTILLRIVQISASAFVIYAVVVSSFMIYASCVAPKDGDTAIVLGAQVKPWGASVLLRQRIDAAQTYLDSHPAAKAVTTGGQGEDEPMSEGQCIYDELTAAGILPDRIFIEGKATNTEENIRYSLGIIQNEGLSNNIAVVTDSYHQLRARIVAYKTDKTVNVSAVNTRNNYIGLSAYPTYFVREWIAIPVEILK